ncbi:MAG: F420-dependent oxidoreductase [Deltaproteobacteria bacterium]|jgi:coenzyme F420-0:L-glutamate ligase/coenzyme F420-1:gamma-L-glutamate ligase|nr:F420-dependent oxidoreductase [Deltaproteobacteria bacterium]
MTISITPIPGVPSIQPGNDLAALLLSSLDAAGLTLGAGDIVVVCQKVVSKAEGRIVDLNSVTPSTFARTLAAQTTGKDPRIVEVVLRETRRIVRMDRGHLITETGPGWICANAGVDESNSLAPHAVVLLPLDPDASAQRLRAAFERRARGGVAVLITDTFGRPWREGLVDFAIGVAGMNGILDLRGQHDLNGRELHHTVMAQADALAAAAGLVMRKGDGIPAALVRGYDFTPAEGSGRHLIRAAEFDLFR